MSVEMSPENLLFFVLYVYGSFINHHISIYMKNNQIGTFLFVKNITSFFSLGAMKMCKYGAI